MPKAKPKRPPPPPWRETARPSRLHQPAPPGTKPEPKKRKRTTKAEAATVPDVLPGKAEVINPPLKTKNSLTDADMVAPPVSEGAPMKAASMAEILFSGVNKDLARLVNTEVLNPSEPYTGELSPVVTLITELMAGFTAGADISALEEQLNTLLHGLEDRINLVKALGQMHEAERYTQHMRTRAKLEQVVHRSVDSRHINVVEALSVLEQLKGEMLSFKKDGFGVGVGKSKSNGFGGGGGSGGGSEEGDILSDLNVALESANYAAKDVVEEKEKHLAGTSPEGRELVRKLVFVRKKAARITQTKIREEIVVDTEEKAESEIVKTSRATKKVKGKDGSK